MSAMPHKSRRSARCRPDLTGPCIFALDFQNSLTARHDFWSGSLQHQGDLFPANDPMHTLLVAVYGREVGLLVTF